MDMDTSDGQRNPENPEEKLSKLKNEVHSICEQLSFLGEESMFLSVKLKDASPFFSGSRLGQAFLFEKSEIIGMFYDYCKLSYSSHELAVKSEGEPGSVSDSSATEDDSSYNYDDSNVYKDVCKDLMPSNKGMIKDKKEKYMQYKARKQKSKLAKEKDVDLNVKEGKDESDKIMPAKRYSTRSLDVRKTEQHCKYSLRNKSRRSSAAFSKKLSEDMSEQSLGSKSLHVKKSPSGKSKKKSKYQSSGDQSEQSSADESMSETEDQAKSSSGNQSKQSTGHQVEQSDEESKTGDQTNLSATRSKQSIGPQIEQSSDGESKTGDQTKSSSGTLSTHSTGYQSSFQSYLANKNREPENTENDTQKTATAVSDLNVYNESTSDYSNISGSDTEEENYFSGKTSESSSVSKKTLKSDSDSKLETCSNTSAQETCKNRSVQKKKCGLSNKKSVKSKDDPSIQACNNGTRRRKDSSSNKETLKSKVDPNKDSRHKGLSFEFKKKYKSQSPNACLGRGSPIQRRKKLSERFQQSLGLMKNKEKSNLPNTAKVTNSLKSGKESIPNTDSDSGREGSTNLSEEFQQSLGLSANKVVANSGLNVCHNSKKPSVDGVGARVVQASVQSILLGVSGNIDHHSYNQKDISNINVLISSVQSASQSASTSKADIICISDSDKEVEEEEEVQITKVDVSPYLEKFVHQNLTNMPGASNAAVPNRPNAGNISQMIVSSNQNVAIMNQPCTGNVCSLRISNSQNVATVKLRNSEKVHSLSSSQNITTLNPPNVSQTTGSTNQNVISLDSPNTENVCQSSLLNGHEVINLDEPNTETDCQVNISNKSSVNVNSSNTEDVCQPSSSKTVNPLSKETTFQACSSKSVSSSNTKIVCHSNSMESDDIPNSEIMCGATSSMNPENIAIVCRPGSPKTVNFQNTEVVSGTSSPKTVKLKKTDVVCQPSSPKTEIVCLPSSSKTVNLQNTEVVCRPSSSKTIDLQNTEVVCRPSSPKYQKCTSSSTVIANVTSQSSSHERQRFTITVDIEQDKIDDSKAEGRDTSDLKQNIKECSVVLNNISSGTARLDYTCKHCSKWFENIDVLRHHERTCSSSGTSGYDYTCKVCSKSFENLSILRRHEETCEMYPGGKRPYECEYCGIRVFNYKCLKIHLKYHK